MPYHVTNRTSRTVLLRLRSGQTLHLAAGARTDDIDGAEINGNRRIASLVDRRLVTVDSSEAAAGSAPKRSKRSGKAKADTGGNAEPTPEGGSQ